mgnify:CR=1 FL=1
MDLDLTTLAPRDAYQLMISFWIPRPIAWTSTIDAAGQVNLAPFSYAGGISSSPPLIMVSIGRRKGEPKDTSRNLLETGEAVVHVCHRPLAEAMSATSADLPPEGDEFDHAGLAKAPSLLVKPPRVAAAPVAMECRVQQHLVPEGSTTDVFILRVVHVHIDDAYVVDGLVDAAKLRAVGRLGGANYCDTAHPFAV